jgi:hypothetical protein
MTVGRALMVFIGSMVIGLSVGLLVNEQVGALWDWLGEEIERFRR